MRINKALLTLTCLALCFSCLAGPATAQKQAGANLPSTSEAQARLDRIVESYRKIIILLDDEASLSDEQRARCVDVGRKIHQEKQHILDELRARVEQERARLRGANASAVNPPKSRTAQAQEHHNLGLKYYREKKYDEAVKELQQAVKLDPKNATIVNNLGFTLYRFEKYEESLVWLRKAIELDPLRAVAYANLADAYFKLGRTAEARQYYEKYAAMAPNSPSIEYVRKRIEELKGK